MSLRGVVTRLHRWPGLMLALWFTCLGLSGSTLVFWRALEDASYPETNAVGEGPAIPVDRAIMMTQARNKSADIYRIFPPFGEERSYRAQYFVGEGENAHGPVTSYVDPSDGRVLGERTWGEAAIHVLYEFHSGLIFGRSGQTVAAFIGLGLGVLALLGLALWFFRTAASLAESLIWRRGLRGLRRWRNLHRAVSIWATLPLIIATLTGGALHFPDVVRALLGRHEVELPAPRWQPPTRDFTIAELFQGAENAMPGWRVLWIDLPPENSGEPFQFIMRRPEADPTEANALVMFNGRSGAIVKIMGPSFTETVRAWIMALHNGTAFGPVHRGFVVLLGFTPAILGLSGFVIWLRRRRAARHARRPLHAAKAPRQIG